MDENRVVALRQPDEIDDPLTEILRSGAKRLVQQAVEAEFASFLARHADLELPDGRQRVVRHGHDPVRPIQTGIGPVEVTKPKARDRGATTADERIRYSSAILPKWARRTKSLDVLLPALYLRGVSTGDFQEVLTALLGKEAPNLSPSVIGRLKSDWEDDYRRWQARDLVGPGNPPHRHPPCPKTDQSRQHHCMVSLATCASSRRSESAHQSKYATVMLARLSVPPSRKSMAYETAGGPGSAHLMLICQALS